MVSGYRILDQRCLNFLTLTVVDWVDVFIRKEYKEIIVESLKFCRSKKGLRIYGYVIMSNHLHLVVQACGEPTLSDIMRDFKKFTAKAILADLETNVFESRRVWMLEKFREKGERYKSNKIYQFWQKGNHPKLLFTPSVINQKLRYIHENPVSQGWVKNPEEYWYSSARYYVTGEGPLLMDEIDFEFLKGYENPFI